jgi:hypothetical protein
MKLGQIISRSTKLPARRGRKKVFIFGILDVPALDPMGNNAVHDIVRYEGEMYFVWRKHLPKKYAAWSVSELANNVFKTTGLEQTIVDKADLALKLLSQGVVSPELDDLAKEIESHIEHMPLQDMTRCVFQSIVRSVQTRTSKGVV